MHFSTREKLILMQSALRNLGVLLGGSAIDPSLIVWLMTYKCNLACRHCNYWQKATPIDPERMMAAAEKIAASRSPIVVLSGGEPLIVPQIREIILMLKRAGKIVSINTNGLLLDEFADFIIEAEVDALTVSMDGAGAQVHDGIRRKKGAFEKSIAGLKALREKRRNMKPRISVRGVLMKDNVDTAPDYVERFQDVADDINFQPVHVDDTKHDVADRKVLFDRQEREKVEAVVEGIAGRYPFFDNGYFRKFPQFLFDPESMQRGAINHCMPIMFFTLVIDPDGNCLTCSENIGNIYEADIGRIWTGPRRRAFLKKTAACGDCSHPCWTNSNVMANPLPGKVLRFLLRL